MERLRERLTTAQRALETINRLPLEKLPSDDVIRDAAIQRFEYTFEAVWKAAQIYLREHEGLEVGSPKGVIRACFRVGLLDEDQTRLALEMADDRNLTVHTYNETLAQAIASRIPAYARLMEQWLKAMIERTERDERAFT